MPCSMLKEGCVVCQGFNCERMNILIVELLRVAAQFVRDYLSKSDMKKFIVRGFRYRNQKKCKL